MARENFKAAKAKRAAKAKKPNDKLRTQAASVSEAVEAESTASANPENSGVGTKDTKFYPSWKDSVQSTGSKTMAPGQLNFLEYASQITTSNGGLRPPMLQVSYTARRTAIAMRIDVQTYFGGSAESGKMTSPIQAALLKMKQYIDTRYNDVQVYDSYDLGPYIMAVVDCYNLAAEIARDIRLLNTRTYQVPAVYPNQIFDLLDICGSNSKPEFPDGDRPTPGSAVRDDSRHISMLSDRFNMIIGLMNTLAVPLDMPLFEYNLDLYDRIYLDAEDAMTAQQYIFASTGSWIYEEGEDDPDEHTGSRVVYHEWPEYDDGSRWKTLDDMLDRLDLMVSRVSSAYTSSMSFLQQITNAYGSQQLRSFPPLDDPRQPVPFEYNPAMLISIENMTLCDQAWPCAFLADAEADALVGTPFMIDQPEYTNLQKYCMIDLPLQFHCPADSVSHEMIGRALRFHPSFTRRTRAKVYTASYPEGAVRDVVTTAGSYGFAIVQRLVLGVLDDSSDMMNILVKHRGIEEVGYTPVLIMNDWNYAPMLISAEFTYNQSLETYRVNAYTGHRDVEVTLSKQEVLNWWTGLTEYAWGTNITAEIRGYREKR